MTIPFAR